MNIETYLYILENLKPNKIYILNIKIFIHFLLLK